MFITDRLRGYHNHMGYVEVNTTVWMQGFTDVLKYSHQTLE
jgi:hypothetical protein